MNECRTPLLSPSPPPSPRTGIRNHYFLPLGHFSLVSVTVLKSIVLKATEVSFYYTEEVSIPCAVESQD